MELSVEAIVSIVWLSILAIAFGVMYLSDRSSYIKRLRNRKAKTNKTQEEKI